MLLYSISIHFLHIFSVKNSVGVKFIPIWHAACSRAQRISSRGRNTRTGDPIFIHHLDFGTDNILQIAILQPQIPEKGLW